MVMESAEPEDNKCSFKPPFVLRALTDLWAVSLVGEAIRGDAVHSTLGRIAMGVLGTVELTISYMNEYPPIFDRSGESQPDQPHE